MRVVTACLLMLLIGPPARGEIYRWVDEHGVTHLDDTLGNVPETARDDAKVFQSRSAPAPQRPSGPVQAAFANGIARDLGLVASDGEGAVSALGIVGIYPSAGWHPSAPLTPAVVEEVTRAARAAARARRLPQAEASVEASVLRVASGLGVAGPPPSAAPEPAAAEPPTIVVAPNIVVEPPPQQTVVVHTVEREQAPVVTQWGWGWDPAFGGGIPFTPIPSGPPGPIPDRITPLSNPAGHLHGPAVPPRPGPQPFRRPLTF
ncbi:MAG: DUF4124 domain-containing protein [Deltaproteobacteria bacterium]|nr:DUF4124 domain-containing protein [Deltaproteobacteria bacterium]